jgi:hypothetical protein
MVKKFGMDDTVVGWDTWRSNMCDSIFAEGRDHHEFLYGMEKGLCYPVPWLASKFMYDSTYTIWLADKKLVDKNPHSILILDWADDNTAIIKISGYIYLSDIRAAKPLYSENDENVSLAYQKGFVNAIRNRAKWAEEALEDHLDDMERNKQAIRDMCKGTLRSVK